HSGTFWTRPSPRSKPVRSTPNPTTLSSRRMSPLRALLYHRAARIHPGLRLDLSQQLLLFIASLTANTLSALAGGGAGLLQLPLLLFLGLGFASALVTHKIASVALGVGATLRHIRESSLNRLFAL